MSLRHDGSGAVDRPTACRRIALDHRCRRGKRPNFLLILADDLGFSDIGCFGSEIATPNLDRLASTGRRFSNLHNNPRCCPSRASLLTGLYPTQAGVGFMTANEGTPQYEGYLNSSCVTIAEALGLAGYRSAIAGKWHVAPASRLDDWPAARGFERSFCQMGGGDYYRPILYEDGKVLGTPDVPADYYLTDDITEHAIESIRTFAAGDDPFFMYLAYKNPHFPLQAPQPAVDEYRGHYDADGTRCGTSGGSATKEQGVIDPAWALPAPAGGHRPVGRRWHRGWQSRRMEVYAAQVALMDQGIGRVIDTLEALGLRENTIVLFMSDNGASAEVVGAGSHLGADDLGRAADAGRQHPGADAGTQQHVPELRHRVGEREQQPVPQVQEMGRRGRDLDTLDRRRGPERCLPAGWTTDFCTWST